MPGACGEHLLHVLAVVPNGWPVQQLAGKAGQREAALAVL